MSEHYKENNFSAENFSTSRTAPQENINKTTRPNIDHLIKRIMVKRRQERNTIIVLCTVSFSVILLFLLFLN